MRFQKKQKHPKILQMSKINSENSRIDLIKPIIRREKRKLDYFCWQRKKNFRLLMKYEQKSSGYHWDVRTVHEAKLTIG